MMDIRNEILKSLPIPDFLTWWHENWVGTSFYTWVGEVLDMEKEGVVKIERGRVELIKNKNK